MLGELLFIELYVYVFVVVVSFNIVEYFSFLGISPGVERLLGRTLLRVLGCGGVLEPGRKRVPFSSILQLSAFVGCVNNCLLVLKLSELLGWIGCRERHGVARSTAPSRSRYIVIGVVMVTR